MPAQRGDRLRTATGDSGSSKRVDGLAEPFEALGLAEERGDAYAREKDHERKFARAQPVDEGGDLIGGCERCFPHCRNNPGSPTVPCDEVRELSRGLHPALLSRGGLRPALGALARKSRLRVDLSVDIDPRPPAPIEIGVYYTVSEALTNAAKHAAASRIAVTVTADADVLRARIEDDGVGGAESSTGSGLIGLVDRIEALGGRFELQSPPGVGTTISIEVPVGAQPVA